MDLSWNNNYEDPTLRWAQQQQQQQQQQLAQQQQQHNQQGQYIDGQQLANTTSPELSDIPHIGYNGGLQAPPVLSPEEEHAMFMNMAAAAHTPSVHSPVGSLYSDYSDHALDNHYHPGAVPIQNAWDAVSSVSGDSSFYPSPAASPHNYLYSPALSAEIDFSTLNLNTDVPPITHNPELGDMLDTPVFPDTPFSLPQPSPNANGHHHQHLRTPSISIEVVEPSPVTSSVNNMKLLDDLMDQSQGVEGIQASFDQGYQEFLRQYNLQDKIPASSREPSPSNQLLNPSTSANRRRRLSEPPYITPNEADTLSLEVPSRRRSKSVSKHKDDANTIYKCEFPGCNKTFTRPYNLSSHARTHTSERPFLCPYPTCDKAFARQHDRNRHAKLHSGIKPHVCQNCGKAFARTDALNRHLKVENGCATALQQRQDQSSPQQHLDDMYFPLQEEQLQLQQQPTPPPPIMHHVDAPQFFFETL